MSGRFLWLYGIRAIVYKQNFFFFFSQQKEIFINLERVQQGGSKTLTQRKTWLQAKLGL